MRLLRQRLAEALQSVQSLLDVREAGGVADAQIVVRAEGDSGHGGDFFLLEQPRAEVGALQSEFRDVREKIKRALRVHARDAGDAVELLPRISAALGVLGEPALQMILRTVERSDAALLREARGVARAVGLNGVDRFCNRLRRGEETQTPTGHAPRFGESMDNDGVVVMRLRKAGDRFVCRTVVGELLVNLVAHDEDAFLHADVAERFDFIGRVNAAGRVAGRIENEQARARRDGGAELHGRDFEFGLVARGKNDRRGARELHHLRIAQPVRRGDDDFVAFGASGENDVVAGMFAAAGDDDLTWLVGEAVIAREFIGDGLAQFRNAARGRVFGETIGECFGAGVFDVLRRVEVRLTGAEADDILAGGFHGFGLGINGERKRRRERCGAWRNFVVHQIGGRT